MDIDNCKIIKFPTCLGITGRVYENKNILIKNMGKKEPYFNVEIDNLSNLFNVQNFIFIPLLNASNKVVGILQLFNKNEKITDKDYVNLHRN